MQYTVAIHAVTCSACVGHVITIPTLIRIPCYRDPLITILRDERIHINSSNEIATSELSSEGLTPTYKLWKLKMNFPMSLLVLTVFAAVSYAAVYPPPTARYDMTVGYINNGDRLLYRGYLHRYAMPNTVQTQDLVYRGNLTTRISAVRAMEVGYTQYGYPSILQGGVGYNYVTVRVQSARGYGYYYAIEIYGR